MSTLLLLPNQLFADVLTRPEKHVVIWMHPLLITQFTFHHQKLLLHTLSVANFANKLRESGKQVSIVQPDQEISGCIPNHDSCSCYDVTDDWIEQDVRKHFPRVTILQSPMFLLDTDTARAEVLTKQGLGMRGFYERQRRRCNILVEPDGKPAGGQWSFDADNRRRLPKDVLVPPPYQVPNSLIEHTTYGWGNIGPLHYASTHEDAANILQQFLEQRLQNFGPYEDALSTHHDQLFHSILTPYLNTGLLTPRQVLNALETYTSTHTISLASHEGFVRQIIGWREYIRAQYLVNGRSMRVENAFDHHYIVPKGFWEGSTGLVPVDIAVRRLQETGYVHHIERLMVLGNAMLLTECAPESVYEWFMAVSIDSYDWVMVPNVYGMSQHADGGRMMTKPYISGSAYLRKMGDYPVGEWCQIWDALYWRFIAKHQVRFSKNPRMAMMPKLWQKLSPEQQAGHLRIAEDYLRALHGL
jgi:deoxyribodipyrimidine photolyase-related protein